MSRLAQRLHAISGWLPPLISVRGFALILLLLVGFIYGVTALARALAIRPDPMKAVAEGSFVRKGHNQETPDPRGFPKPRLWGSWIGDDSKTGSLKLGPFRADENVAFFVSGFPMNGGNTIRLIRADTGESIPVEVENPGHVWRFISVPVPEYWVGKSLILEATDRATDSFGWLGVSEPLGTYVSTDVAEYLLELLLVLGILCPVIVFALHELATRNWLAPHWHLLAAGAFVSLLAYAIFWLTFLSPILGKAAAFLSVAGAWAWVFKNRGRSQIVPESIACGRLLVLLGIALIAALAWYVAPMDYAILAQNRYVPRLPGDNMLPEEFARLLLNGREAIHIGSDWLTSDRPPLQTALLTLILPFSNLLGLAPENAAGVTGTVFQLLWVPALYAVFRELGIVAKKALGFTAALSATGFFALHTVFVWPKLAAAAFGLGVFGLWILSSRRHGRVEIVVGALLAALAWLCHGGIAFSFIALLPWLLFKLRPSALRHWAIACLGFLVVAAPWVAFQKLYAPPANRLLKWHLAGQVAIDPRPFGQTLREAYASKPLSAHIQAKEYNLGMQVGHYWRDFFPWSDPGPSSRRHYEFFFTARAVGLWLLGIPVALAACFFSRFGLSRRGLIHLTLWTLLSYVVWCILMFDGGQAVIHQGSYASLCALFLLAAAGLSRLPSKVVGGFLVLQVSYFLWVWWGPTEVIPERINPAAVLVMVFALSGLALALGRNRLLPTSIADDKDSTLSR